MTNAIKRDGNSQAVAAGILNTDGVTPTMVTSDPTLHLLMVDDASTGSVSASADARRDDNSITTLLAASSSDGSTPVELAVNSSGQLLVQST